MRESADQVHALRDHAVQLFGADSGRVEQWEVGAIYRGGGAPGGAPPGPGPPGGGGGPQARRFGAHPLGLTPARGIPAQYSGGFAPRGIGGAYGVGLAAGAAGEPAHLGAGEFGAGGGGEDRTDSLGESDRRRRHSHGAAPGSRNRRRAVDIRCTSSGPS